MVRIKASKLTVDQDEAARSAEKKGERRGE